MDRLYSLRDGDIAKVRHQVDSFLVRAVPRNVYVGGSSAATLLRRCLIRVPTFLVLFWIWLTYWGERTVFNDSIEQCKWEHWEKWPKYASPHHVAFISDPQLVDPHTYPGRPWPLSTLTVAFTDNYMKRSFRTLQRDIEPDSTIFLGDLFDGGREWGTKHPGFKPSEEQWKPYGESFWLGEYDRLGNIFFDKDQISGGKSDRKQQKLLTTLPGNHDLGFAKGIQPVVRRRFHAYFGEGDRVDIIGNHTIVSLDTVSLSAMDYPDAPPALWDKTMLFLDNVQDYADRMVQIELNSRDGLQIGNKFLHVMTEPQEVVRESDGSSRARYQLPTIVLSHVPFYREPGKPCGPLREKYPPSEKNLDNDDQNAIRVAAGYQYQNVLSPDVSRIIAEKVGNVGVVFSGDDHDYCELTHTEYPSAGNGIKEITVKSFSWAMGVRHPGFVLASLWHPINKHGRTLPDGTGYTTRPTIQTHLCLLPDRLGVFIKYLVGLVFTLMILVMNSVIIALRRKDSQSLDIPVLPTREPQKVMDDHFTGRSRSSSKSLHGEGNGLLAPRSVNARNRSVSPGIALGSYAFNNTSEKSYVPLIEHAGYYGNGKDDKYEKDDTDEWGYDTKRKPTSPRRQKGFLFLLLVQFGFDVVTVGGPALLWYYHLMTSW